MISISQSSLPILQEQKMKWSKSQTSKEENAHRARLRWVLATASVETANVEKIFIISEGGEEFFVAGETKKADALTDHRELRMLEVIGHAGFGMSVNQGHILLDAIALAIALPIIA